MRLILAMLVTVDMDVFWEVQFAFFLIILLGTFSRSECPCPKTFTGKDRWNPDKHWMVQDIAIQLVASDGEVEDDEEDEEDEEEHEEPALVAMPTPGVNLQPEGALVGTAAIASPIGRAIHRVNRELQRLLY